MTGPSPLRDGAKIRLGDAELRVERRRDAAEAGRTMFVPAGATGFMPSIGGSGTQFGMRPRVRSGYALKRLDASEGRQRWVLEGSAQRDVPAALGQRRVGVRAASTARTRCSSWWRCASSGSGRPGPPGWCGCLTDLGERGFLSGVAGSTPAGEAPTSWWRQAGPAAREDLHRARPADRGALPQRRLGVLHAPGADRAGRAGRARAGVVHLPDRRALRDAVRGGVEVRPGRARVPARALRGRGRARDRARADDGVVRAARGQGGPEDDRDLPVRVRGHVARRGSSRAGGGSR